MKCTPSIDPRPDSSAERSPRGATIPDWVYDLTKGPKAQRSLSPGDLLILHCVLGFRRAGRMTCWCTNKTIAQRVGVSVRTVQLALRRLEAAGVIRRVWVGPSDPHDERNRTGWSFRLDLDRPCKRAFEPVRQPRRERRAASLPGMSGIAPPGVPDFAPKVWGLERTPGTTTVSSTSQAAHATPASPASSSWFAPLPGPDPPPSACIQPPVSDGPESLPAPVATTIDAPQVVETLAAITVLVQEIVPDAGSTPQPAVKVAQLVPGLSVLRVLDWVRRFGVDLVGLAVAWLIIRLRHPRPAQRPRQAYWVEAVLLTWSREIADGVRTYADIADEIAAAARPPGAGTKIPIRGVPTHQNHNPLPTPEVRTAWDSETQAAIAAGYRCASWRQMADFPAKEGR
jgi:hypothetical protein